MAGQEFTTEELETEEWRDIPGFPSYQASTLGRIRRSKPSPYSYVGKILKPYKNRYGYLNVLPSENGVHPARLVHQLVAAAFLGKRPEGFHTNHIDGCKQNNRPINLEYCTALENTRHAIRTGLTKTKGQGNGRSKLTDDDVREIRRLIAAGMANWHIAPLFGVSNALVGLIKNGRNWTHVK